MKNRPLSSCLLPQTSSRVSIKQLDPDLDGVVVDDGATRVHYYA